MNVDRTSSSSWQSIDPKMSLRISLPGFFHCSLFATLQNCSWPSCCSAPYVWELSISLFPELQIVSSETDWALGENWEECFLSPSRQLKQIVPPKLLIRATDAILIKTCTLERYGILYAITPTCPCHDGHNMVGHDVLYVLMDVSVSCYFRIEVSTVKMMIGIIRMIRSEEGMKKQQPNQQDMCNFFRY